MSDEGVSVSNGINYGYTFSSSDYFGRYQCRIHSLFLTEPVEIYTQTFQIGGYLWQMRVMHKDDGNLAAYVYSRSHAAPEVRFSFTLISHDARKESKRWGDVHHIENGQCWGFRKLETIETIKNRNSGHVLNDIFIVRLDLRLKLQGNETHSFQADNKHGVFLWRLKHVHDQSPWVYVSEELEIGPTKWQIQFYPEGQRHGQSHASIFLYSHNNTAVKIKLQVSCINTMLASDNISRTLEYDFQDNNEGRGWFEFLERKVLEDARYGFVRDGWLSIKADITVADNQIEDQQAAQVVNQQPAHAGRNVPRNADEQPLCVFCINKVQTSGVLHGDTTHKCYCLDCARFLKGRQEELHCPICGEKVERIIEKFF